LSIGQFKSIYEDIFKEKADDFFKSSFDRDSKPVIEIQISGQIYLKRAAILLFHPFPENFVTGSYIKIGYFQSDDELVFQDAIHGNLFEQIEKTIDLLFTKYIKAEISYEGINRVEKYEYPKEAIREALLNAVAHKDYSGGVPIQISVYRDKIIFWNEGQLPENWTIKNLLVKHASRPYNPDIAIALFRSGYIESWGRGTIKILNECKQAGIPEPVFSYDSSDMSVEFRQDIYNEKYLNSLNLNERQIKAVLYLKEKGKINNSNYQNLNNVSRETATRDLKELIDKQLMKPSGQKGAGAFYTLI
jgi:ATP-dependent DNA helicase RecG